MKLFVYGSLKKGFSLHRALENIKAKYIGTGKTHPDFTMLDLGPYPGVITDGRTSIKGEVYEINDQDINVLDRIEGHPGYYERCITEIFPCPPEPFKEGFNSLADEPIGCSIYILKHASTNREVTTGVWVR